MNCLIYARVSTDRQADRALSIPAQLQAAREHARRHEWRILEEYVEAGCSGRTADRPVLHRLLKRCRENPKVDVVLVHKIDRLARNVYDHATIRTFLKQKGVKLASVVEAVDDSVAGQLLENIMASIAEFYSANLGQETKKGMQTMVNRGGWPHQPPRGYKNQRSENGRAHISVDPDVGPSVQRVFELYATGHHSFRDLKPALEREGLVLPVASNHLRRMLANPFYIGQIHWNGKAYLGSHPSLVSQALFDQVALVLRTRRRRYGRRPIHEFVLRGIARCATCDLRVTAERHRRWGYYRCSSNCPGAYSNADRVHEQLVAIYSRVTLNDPLRDILRATLGAIDGRLQELESRKASVRAVVVERLERRRLRAAEALADGLIAPDVYRAMIEKIDSQLEKPSDSEDVGRQFRLASEALAKDDSLADVYARLDVQGQGELAKAVLGRVVLRKGQIVECRFQRIIDDAAQAA